MSVNKMAECGDTCLPFQHLDDRAKPVSVGSRPAWSYVVRPCLKKKNKDKNKVEM